MNACDEQTLIAQLEDSHLSTEWIERVNEDDDHNTILSITKDVLFYHCSLRDVLLLDMKCIVIVSIIIYLAR